MSDVMKDLVEISWLQSYFGLSSLNGQIVVSYNSNFSNKI